MSWMSGALGLAAGGGGGRAFTLSATNCSCGSTAGVKARTKPRNRNGSRLETARLSEKIP